MVFPALVFDAINQVANWPGDIRGVCVAGLDTMKITSREQKLFDLFSERCEFRRQVACRCRCDVRHCPFIEFSRLILTLIQGE